MTLGRPEYVSDLIVYLLNQLGIDYATTNPGATTRGMHESIVSYGANRSPEMITCCHEELAVAMAEGYYLATGKPLAALVHNIVGLQHASKAIYEAWLAGVPMLVIGGTGPVDLSHRRPWIDWIHTPQVQGQIVRDYVKWDDQPEGARSVAESILRAYQIAMTEPRGPVYLCFDVELQEALLPEDFDIPDVSRYLPGHPPAGNPQAIAEAAQALMDAEWPVILAQEMGLTPGGSDALVSLAELMGIPVIEVGPSFCLPNTHPLNVTGANSDVLRDADLVLTIGVKDIDNSLKTPVHQAGSIPEGLPRIPSSNIRRYESLISESTKLVRIGLEDYGVKSWVSHYGRLTAADVPILGDGAEVLKELANICKGSMNGSTEAKAKARTTKAEEINSGIRSKAQTDLRERWWDQTPISTARLASEVWDAIKDEDWVLVHGSLSGWEKRLWNTIDEKHWIAGGGGTGTGMGVAMGTALAFKGTDKVCVSIQNDGDLLYTPGSLWTVAHHEIPMLVVMFNNKAYYQDVGHQRAVTTLRERSLENLHVGVSLEGPDTDFATLARSFSIYGDGPITQPGDISAALKKGLRVVKEEGKAALIDTVTQPR